MSHVDGVDDGVGYGVSGTEHSQRWLWCGWRTSSVGHGVYGKSNGGIGVYGDRQWCVWHEQWRQWCVWRGSSSVYGGPDRDCCSWHQSTTMVVGVSNTCGLYGKSVNDYAAVLDGNVTIAGNLQKAGGSFKIDHPLDPANKYLSHSFVESPDMKNVYDGVVVLDYKGKAEIELPDWFGILNKDFRYQLTAIGAPGPNLYIAEKISDTTTSNKDKNNNSRFKIAGGTSGMEVSWQVTGIRKDPWANAHRVQVEEDKPAKERGYYLHPDVYGQPEENGISHLLFPKEKKELLVNK